jgi:hypothetical protein
MFRNLISARYPEIDSSFAHKSGYVGCGEKDKGYLMVLDKGDVEAVSALELDVGAFKEFEGCLLETALWV